MRIRRFVVLALAAGLLAGVGASDAEALTASIALSKDKTTAYSKPSGPPMTPYGAAVHALILTEIKRSHLPFMLTTSARFPVRFDVDRRGQVVHFAVARGGGLKVVDDYLEMVVRAAVRAYAPNAANLPAERVTFWIPVSFRF